MEGRRETEKWKMTDDEEKREAKEERSEEKVRIANAARKEGKRGE